MTTTNAIGVTTPGAVVYSGTLFTGETLPVTDGGTGLATSTTAYSVVCSGTTATGAYQVLSSLGTAGQVLTSAGAAALPAWATVNVGSAPWTDEAAPFTAADGNGYFVTATAAATLPATPAQGATIYFIVDATATVLTITANTGQTIRLGTTVSAAAGTAASTAWGDSITLVYRTADTSWIASSVIGNWTIS